MDNSKYMTDDYQRPVTNLRISITTDCELNCFYCHEEGQKDSGRVMDVIEIERIARIAKEMNIEKIKLTGGEPLVRPEITEIIKSISNYMKDTSLTTNGVKLKELASEMSKSGLDRLNISLDSLNPENYHEITGKKVLSKVKAGIEEAINTDLYPIKLNSLILNNKNNDEIWDFIEYAANKDVILQLIELETDKVGSTDEWFQENFFDLGSIEKELSKKAEKTKERRMHRRKKYFLPYNGNEVEVEVVRPMHNSKFCMGCTRLRITSNGYLKTCLFEEGDIDLIGPMREGATDEKIKNIFKEATMNREPYWN